MTGGRVVVLGSINHDLLASVPRLPRAGETIAGSNLARQLGGKGANQAVAAARAAAPVKLVAAIGDDAEGAAMVRCLAGHGVDVSSVVRRPAPTGHALVMTSPQDNQIVVVAGANGLVDRALAAGAPLAPGDIGLAQMEIPAEAAQAFFVRARSMGALTMLNAAPASAAVLPLLPLVDVLVVNEGELALMSGAKLGDNANEADLAQAIAAPGLAGVPTIIVTLGARGAMLATSTGLRRIAGRPARVVDTTGAGDCFCGYLAAGLARGDALETAVAEANIAASIAVQSLGAASAIPSRSTILPALAAVASQGS